MDGLRLTILCCQIRKTIKKVTIVVPVLITSCQFFGILEDQCRDRPYNDSSERHEKRPFAPVIRMVQFESA